MSERKRTKTQRAILHAAKVLYEKQGVGNVPFDDIAETAGVCRTTVFNHFADAAELQQALAVAEIGELIEFGEESSLSGLALIFALLDCSLLFCAAITCLAPLPRVLGLPWPALAFFAAAIAMTLALFDRRRWAV